jgi:hypothetical protein
MALMYGKEKDAEHELSESLVAHPLIEFKL